ncbi:hypothetical protein PVL29_018681 [Vitis rotundifolia]|uniref:ATP synthase subunit beta, mitochondrial n=1 Tax=Vitis rotundifolia TaxID=103349 RepID=A0AA38Z5S2_VITRO|nr:hypothetical protein PVL29_018681 [Vitis rotundifolia]
MASRKLLSMLLWSSLCCDYVPRSSSAIAKSASPPPRGFLLNGVVNYTAAKARSGLHDCKIIDEFIAIGSECQVIVPVGRAMLGCIINVIGEPIDEKGEIKTDHFLLIHQEALVFVVDLLAPYQRGEKIGLFGGASVGKTMLIMELINNVAKAHVGNDLYREMIESGVIKLGDNKSKCAIIYGQMNEPFGAHVHVGLIGLTDLIITFSKFLLGPFSLSLFSLFILSVLILFTDNIFRFTQANFEVFALLGRIPFAVGYQPTLVTNLGGLQERITSTKKRFITSIQAINVDDLTNPTPATTFAHLDATTIFELGIYPAVDLLDSTSCMLSLHILGEEHYNTARDIIAILGMDELSEDDKLTVASARKIQRFLKQPFHVAEVFTGALGKCGVEREYFKFLVSVHFYMFGSVMLNNIMRNTNGSFFVTIEFNGELYCYA